MLSSVLLSICVKFWYYFNNVAEVRSENALLYSLKQITKTLDENTTPCITACPANTEQEKKFNKEVSVSGNSLFLREFYNSNDSPYNIELDVCEKPFQPVLVYDSKHDKYHIGYELYYDNSNGVKIPPVYENYYDQYRSVKIENYDKITHLKKPFNNLFAKYVDGQGTMFYSVNGSETLVFHWIPVFVVNYSMYKKRIMLTYNARLNDDLQHDPNTTCDNFDLKDENVTNLFSEINQEKCLKDIVTQTSLSETPPPVSCGQAYGCLEKSQVIPLWYFRSRSTQLASCMRMNIIPVWKTIVDGQLKKVDEYILTILHSWRQTLNINNDRKFGDIIYGTWSWLKLPTKTDPSKPQPIFLSDPETNQTMPVPKLIYRIVSVWWRAVAIIIHNDLGPIPESDRICTNKTFVPGWGNITNEDWTTGLTYTCRLTQEVDLKLGGNVVNLQRYKSALQGSPHQSQGLVSDYHEIRVKKPLQ